MERSNEHVYAIINILPNGQCIIKRIFHPFFEQINLLRGSNVTAARMEVDGGPMPFQATRTIRARIVGQSEMEEHAIDHYIENGTHVLVFGSAKEYIPVQCHLLLHENVRLSLPVKLDESQIVHLTEMTPNFSAKVQHVLEGQTLTRLLHVKNSTGETFDSMKVFVSAAEPERRFVARGAEYEMAAMGLPSSGPGDTNGSGYDVFDLEEVPDEADSKFIINSVGVKNMKWAFEVTVGPDSYDSAGSVMMTVEIDKNVIPGLFTVMGIDGSLIAKNQLTKNYPPNKKIPVGKTGWVTYEVNRNEKRGQNNNLEKVELTLTVKVHGLAVSPVIRVVSKAKPALEKWREEEGVWITETVLESIAVWQKKITYTF